MPVAEKHLWCPLYSLMSTLIALGHSHSDTRYQEYRNPFKAKKFAGSSCQHKEPNADFLGLVSEVPFVMSVPSICLPASLGTVLQIDFSLRPTTASWQHRLNPGTVDIPLHASPLAICYDVQLISESLSSIT